MRVAMFVGAFPLISETFILRQITGLIDLGHEVDIFAENRPPNDAPLHSEVLKYDLLARTTYMDIPPASGYWELPVWPLSEQTWIPDSGEPIPNEERALKAVPDLIRCLSTAPRVTFKVLHPDEYGYQALSLSALYRLSRLCSLSTIYDVIHAHFGPTGNSFRFTKELWDAPFVVTFHGYDFSTVPHKEGSDIYHKLFEVADAVTGNSEYTLERLGNLGCDSSKLRLLRVGLELQDFQFCERSCNANEPVRVLTVGRLVQKKGIEYSIRAVAKAQQKHPNIRYDIIGDGPLRSDLDALIHQLGAEHFIALRGAKESDSVRHMMSEAHIFVLSSVTTEDGDQEGTPVSLMEAQACGLPALSTWHSGIPEIVLDGTTGFLCPERDVEALTQSLNYLLEHRDIWPEMGRRGRKHVEGHYDLRKLNEQLVSLYQSLK